MSQYSTGTATVTNGSATVTGTNTLWLANVSAGDSFTVAGDGVMYDVASVDSDTQITLSVAYAGVTAAGVVYTIARDFTSPDSFPELTTGDIETPTIITRALRKIQSRFTGIAINTTAEIGQAVNDHVALPDPHAQYAEIAGGAAANFTAMPQVGGSLLVEPATTSKTGTVEKATTTEAKEGTADKFPDAAGVHAAFNQYGLGESATSLIDANDMVTPGTFGGPGAGGVNFPGTTEYGFLRVSGRYSSILSQEALSGGDRYYMRHTDDGGVTWTAWEQIYHTGMTPNFPDMPQVGGDPIVESGSNADGEWTRWADGTQIASTSNFAFSSVTSSAEWADSWTFPIAFLAQPKVTPPVLPTNSAEWGNINSRDIISFCGYSTSTSTTATPLRVWAEGSSANGAISSVQVTAIGRWK